MLSWLSLIFSSAIPGIKAGIVSTTANAVAVFWHQQSDRVNAAAPL